MLGSDGKLAIACEALAQGLFPPKQNWTIAATGCGDRRVERATPRATDAYGVSLVAVMDVFTTSAHAQESFQSTTL